MCSSGHRAVATTPATTPITTPSSDRFPVASAVRRSQPSLRHHRASGTRWKAAGQKANLKRQARYGALSTGVPRCGPPRRTSSPNRALQAYTSVCAALLCVGSEHVDNDGFESIAHERLPSLTWDVGGGRPWAHACRAARTTQQGCRTGRDRGSRSESSGSHRTGHRRRARPRRCPP